VPGVGDFGDRYYGTTGYAEGLWGTNGRWHFPGWAFGPRGASMRQPRPCDVKREEKRQYIDAKKKAKKRQSRNHVAGVEPTQWPHCNGTWIDRYIISKLMVSDIPSYPIKTNPMNVHKNYHHGNHSHDPAGHPLGPSIRQEQRHLESLWPVGDPGGFHGEIWCRMVSDSMGTSEMGRNGYHKYWFNRDSMGFIYIYLYNYIYICFIRDSMGLSYNLTGTYLYLDVFDHDLASWCQWNDGKQRGTIPIAGLISAIFWLVKYYSATFMQLA
jgi:Zn-finger nucleic acid-binding protein